MAADFYALGPAHIFVQFRTGTGSSYESAVYLGTCETAPQDSDEPKYVPVMNNIGGSEVPVQLTYQRRQITVAGVFNRYDYSVVRRIMDPARIGLPGTMGIDNRCATGSLVLGRTDFRLIRVNQFSGFAPTCIGLPEDAPVGRMYFAAVQAKVDIQKAAAGVDALPMVFQTIGLYDPATKGFAHYTELASDFPAIPPVT
jgi:hypothetical protein